MNTLASEIEISIKRMLDEAYLCRINDLKLSNSLAKKSLAKSNEIKNFNLVGLSLNQLALVAMIRGEHSKAIKFSKEAIRLFKLKGNERGIADAKYNLAGVYYKTDNYHLGLANLVDCQGVYEKYNDYHNLARVHKSLGTIYEYFGDIKNAIRSYKRAIIFAKKVGDLNLKSNAYNPLSGIYLKLGKTEQARAIINRSVEIKTQTNDIRGLAFALYGRAKVFAKSGAYDEAEKDFIHSLQIHERMEEKLGRGMALAKLGFMYKEIGRIEEAKKTLKEALAHSTEHHISFVKYKCNHHLYELHRSEGETDYALRYLEAYLKEKEAVINDQTFKIIESYELTAKMNALEQQAIKEREKAEIMEKKNRAEQSAIVKQEFLSTMSHEIRTPLNAVITITSLLSDKTNKEEKQLIDSLKLAGNNLMLIINDILDFTKLDSGNAVLEKSSVELHPMLLNIQNIYEGMAREKGLEIKLSIDESLCQTYLIDRTKLMQILGNLISNAIKFTDKGYVSLTAKKMFNEGEKFDAVRFWVSDTGSGILPIHREQIFESFFQPYSITTRKHSGSGLGLAIVKKLVELHGSSIMLNSKVNVGSEFYFDLVLEKSMLSAISNPVDISILNGKRVLLAEDNMINAMVAMKLLKGWGMITTHAKNGLEAIEKAGKNEYDYILMDIHMPELDGYGAAKQIKSREGKNKSVPLFALTADITANQKREYHGYFDAFLRKPIEVNTLQNELLSAIK